jgi:hypothetical protein
MLLQFSALPSKIQPASVKAPVSTLKSEGAVLLICAWELGIDGALDVSD